MSSAASRTSVELMLEPPSPRRMNGCAQWANGTGIQLLIIPTTGRLHYFPRQAAQGVPGLPSVSSDPPQAHSRQTLVAMSESCSAYWSTSTCTRRLHTHLDDNRGKSRLAAPCWTLQLTSSVQPAREPATRPSCVVFRTLSILSVRGYFSKGPSVLPLKALGQC